jgi:tetratricopeptide (TPR) repeat protein
LLLASILAGCASTSSFKAGLEAERAEDFDRAVVEYEKALRAKPDHMTTRLSLQRAKLRAAAYHDQRARRLAGTGKLEEALIELQIAAELNPASGDIDNRLRDCAAARPSSPSGPTARRGSRPSQAPPICSPPASSCRRA